MSVSGLAMNKLTGRSAILQFRHSALRSLSAFPFLILFVITLTYLYFRFEKLIKCPSCYLFSDGGDGLKNYFTVAYYVHHDKGLWFHGMNYPYGEHPVYTDNQPVWSMLMKLVNLIFPMEQHVVGTMNMLLIASLAIAVVAIYFLLREFNLPKWYAALVSLPIVFLSPQLERMNGHYSLAYVCYLPLFLLLFVRWQRKMSWQRSLGLVLFIAWTGFTHLYFFFIAVAFMIAYFVVLWVRNRFKWKSKLSRLLLVVIATGITVYLPVKLTDPVKDRPKEVYGLYVFAATRAGTFLPWYGEWHKTWTEKYHLKAIDLESHSYLGIAGVLLLPFILIYAIRNLVLRRRREELLNASDTSPGVMVWAGFLVWFMATGWFYMAGGSILIDTFPVLGQFRSLGRLAWIFYFVYNCFAVWFVYEGIKALRRGWLKTACIGLAALLFTTWMYEASIFTHESTKHVYHDNHILRGDKPFLELLHQHGMKPDDFQAILQVPLIIIGTENLPVHRGHWEFNNTLQCAWETGLPIVNYNMSRTSVSHALSLLQLISTPDIPKVRLTDMNDKPLLLTAHVAQLLPTEQGLIDLADSLGMVGTMGLYKLDISDFNEPMAPDTAQWEILVDESFEQTPSAHAFEGNGAHTSIADSVYLTFVDTTIHTELSFSCWVYIASDVAGFPATRIIQYGPDDVQLDEQVYSIHSFNPWQVKGNWVEVTFLLQSKVQSAQYDFSILTDGALIDKVVIKRKKEQLNSE